MLKGRHSMYQNVWFFETNWYMLVEGKGKRMRVRRR